MFLHHLCHFSWNVLGLKGRFDCLVLGIDLFQRAVLEADRLADRGGLEGDMAYPLQVGRILSELDCVLFLNLDCRPLHRQV